MLEVRIPKPAERRPHSIKIGAGGQAPAIEGSAEPAGDDAAHAEGSNGSATDKAKATA